MNSNSSNQFLYLRAIQGHSGQSATDPALQDNVLVPKDFTEHICHVGNANELNFFTTVNPMEDENGMGETA